MFITKKLMLDVFLKKIEAVHAIRAEENVS